MKDKEEIDVEAPEPEKSLLFKIWNSAKSKKTKHNEEVSKKHEQIEKNVEAAAKQSPPPLVQVEDVQDVMPGKGNYLQAIRKNLSTKELNTITQTKFSSFMLDDSVPEREQKTFFKELQNFARPILEEKEKYLEAVKIWNSIKDEAEKKIELDKMQQSLLADLENGESDKYLSEAKKLELAQLLRDNKNNVQNDKTKKVDEVKEPPSPTPQDASVQVRLPIDRMQAWIFVFPPRYGGRDVSLEDIKAAIQAAGVKYGLDSEIIARVVNEKIYMKLVVIAKGLHPIDGIDGAVEDLFPRVFTMELKENDNRLIDYKDLNWLHQTKAGDVISKIVLPTVSADGMRVTGEECKARVGREAIIPKGLNTVINDDGTALIAEIDGQVAFADGKFKVERILNIKGDVDNATGNLDAIGDIIVHGDVRNGFSIKATGNITIKGMAEGAWVIAGGNIQVGMGMNGNGRGVLDAKGDVKCKYLENCTVNAGGSIFSDSIINSNVYSNDRIQVKTGHGVIIGGSITAVNEISARVVGNQSSRPTVLVLGSTPNILKEKSDLLESMRRLNAEMEETAKGINYLQAGNSCSEEQRKMLSDLKLKSPIQLIQKAKIEQRLREIQRLDNDLTGCHIVCDTLYPPTQLTIGHAMTMVQQTETHCNIYYSMGEIHIGS